MEKTEIPKELELKYTVDEVNLTIATDTLIALFRDNGFVLKEITTKENSDEYYDTRDLDFSNTGESLRIRTVTKNGQLKYKGTYKIPSDKQTDYLSREEAEEPLEVPNFENLKTTISKKSNLDFSNILELPILNSTTSRTDIVFEKDDSTVCLSVDKTIYTNHFLEEIKSSDTMIEIELENSSNTLDEINLLISKNMGHILTINKQNKYQRGLEKTLFAFDYKNTKDDLVKIIKSEY